MCIIFFSCLVHEGTHYMFIKGINERKSWWIHEWMISSNLNLKIVNVFPLALSGSRDIKKCPWLRRNKWNNIFKFLIIFIIYSVQRCQCSSEPSHSLWSSLPSLLYHPSPALIGLGCIITFFFLFLKGILLGSVFSITIPCYPAFFSSNYSIWNNSM